MVTPIIRFKGVKYKSGTAEGWRPQLEKAQKVSDLELAEEIVLARRMAMSPDELLHALRTALATAPLLVAEDGRIREFTDLLRYNRTASGKLTGAGGGWNSTCHARVRAQLQKESKAEIRAHFVNEIESTDVKIDNVTYVGAASVTNVLKPGHAFAAYGRNMAFDASKGDEAWLTVGCPAPLYLRCTESDAAHAAFSWPTGAEPVPGAKMTFTMCSHGGDPEGGTAVNVKRDIVVIEGDTPLPAFIDQSRDGRVRVNTIAQDGQSAAFTPGAVWTLIGKGLTRNTHKADVFVYETPLVDCGDGTTPQVACSATSVSSAELHVTLPTGEVPAGSYPDAKLLIPLSTEEYPRCETLTIPINLVVA